MLSNFLKMCTMCAWWLDTSVASVFLFGEYPSPQKSDYEDA